MNKKVNIVFAHNDRKLLNAIRDLLKHFNLIGAASVAEAMYHLHTSEAALLVADARMRGLPMLLETVSLASPKTNIVMIAHDDKDRQWADSRGLKTIHKQTIFNCFDSDLAPASCELAV